jgi:HAMP domain-containing protein
VRADLPSYFLNVKAHGPEGVALGSSSGNRGINVTDRKYFIDALAGNAFVVGDPVVSRSTGKWTLTFSRALFDVEGRASGMVGATLELTVMEPLLVADGLPAGSIVSLLNQDAVILGRSVDADRWVGTVSTPSYIQDQVMARPSGTFEFENPEGDRRLAGYWTNVRAPGKVWVRVPGEIAFVGVERRLTNALLLSAVTLAATLVLAWFMASRITRPLRQLAADAGALAEGGELKPSRVDSSGEVGQLAAAFKQMLLTLNQRDAALRQSGGPDTRAD